MEHLTPIIVVLGGTWIAMYHCVEIVEKMNAKRDLILGIDAEGSHLTPEQKRLLLYSDYIPL